MHATAVRASVDARPHCRYDASFLENPCEYPHKLYTARN